MKPQPPLLPGRCLRLVLLLASLILTPMGIRAETSTLSLKRDHSLSPYLQKQLGPAAAPFERNLGQTDAQVKFLARGQGYTLFLTSSGPAFVLGRGPERALLKMRMEGADFSREVHGEQILSG